MGKEEGWVSDVGDGSHSVSHTIYLLAFRWDQKISWDPTRDLFFFDLAVCFVRMSTDF